MKKALLRTSAIAFAALLLTTGLSAQTTKDKDKSEKDSKNKMGEYDEIIIKRKTTDKDAKVVVEIRDGVVLVDGKPLDDYDNDNISVRKNKVTVWNGNARSRAVQTSPFRTYEAQSSTHGFLGVVTEKDAKGTRISDVTDNSAAEKAGLKSDDVITKVDDTKIEDHDDLVKAITKKKPSDKVVITYLRDGKELKTTATLGKTSGSSYSYTIPKVDVMPKFENFNYNWDGQGSTVYSYNGRPRLGIRAQDTDDGKGVKVLDVDEESIAYKAGLREDDIITEFDGKTVNSADALADAAKGTKEKTAFTVKYTRAGKAHTAEIKIPKKLKTTNL